MKGKPFTENRHIFYAGDQSCIAGFGTVIKVSGAVDMRSVSCRYWIQEDNPETSRLDLTLLKQCTARSPFTGCMWKKLHAFDDPDRL